MAESKPSPWVWIFLVTLLVSFAGFIVFLDQKLVQPQAQPSQPATAPQNPETKPTIDFYSVLPQREVEIPVSDARGQPASVIRGVRRRLVQKLRSRVIEQHIGTGGMQVVANLA